MKKTLALLLLLAVAAAGGSTYWGSLEAERRFHQAAAIYSQWPYQPERSYQRGFLRSAATERIPLQGGAGVMLVNDCQIVHGPIPWGLLAEGDYNLRPTLAAIRCTVRLEAGDVPEVVQSFLAAFRPTVEARLPLRGPQRAVLHLPATQVSVADGGGFEFAALSGAIDVPASFSKVSGNFNWPGVTYRDAEGLVVTLEELAYSFQYDDLAAGRGLSPATDNLRLNSIRLEAEAGTPLFELTGFAATNDLAQEEEQLRLASDLRFADFRVGPVPTLGATSLDFGARVGRDAYSAWLEAILELVELGEAEEIDGEAAVGVGKLFSALIPLLSDSTQSLSLHTDLLGQGGLHAAGEINWGALSGETLDAPTVLERMDGELILRVPNFALAETLVSYLHAGPGGGQDPTPVAGKEGSPVAAPLTVEQVERFFVPDREGNYHFRGTWNAGILTINGVSTDVLGRLRERGEAGAEPGLPGGAPVLPPTPPGGF